MTVSAPSAPQQAPSWAQLFRRLSDDTDPESLGTRLRRRRMSVALDLIDAADAGHDRPRVLDVGGTPRFWDHMGLTDGQLDITVVNLVDDGDHRRGVRVVTADATNLPFGDDTFDLAFSNSAIEHVGGPDAQQRMLGEMRRVGRRLFLQTPCRWFPIEPHFHFPFFGVLPFETRVWLVRHLDLGHAGRIPDAERARARVDGVQLLRRRDLRRHAPAGSALRYERFAGWPKSHLLYGETTSPGKTRGPTP